MLFRFYLCIVHYPFYYAYLDMDLFGVNLDSWFTHEFEDFKFQNKSANQYSIVKKDIFLIQNVIESLIFSEIVIYVYSKENLLF